MTALRRSEPAVGAVSRLLDSLETAECGPRRSGVGWLSLCPAHEDRSPSLSVREGHDGRVLVHCFAGCGPEQITGALGLRSCDLFDAQVVSSRGATTQAHRTTAAPAPLPSEEQVRSWERRLHRTPAALELAWSAKRWIPQALVALDVGWDGQRFTLPIRDSSGELVNVCRYLPRGRPKLLALRGRPRDLFPTPERLRESLGSVRLGVYLVEGEPDAISAASGGIIAVAVPGSQGWRAAWAPRFVGMHLRVLADHDDAGRRLAVAASSDLAVHAASVRVLAWPAVIGREPQHGFDLGDWLLAQPQQDGAA
jgi:hypothetical protein